MPLRSVIALFMIALPCSAGTLRPESWYSDRVAEALGGCREVVVPRGRADVVTETHAIEVEFAAKWKNSIGQALWYGFQLNKSAGIVLIMEDPVKDAPSAIALASLIQHHQLPIKLWLWPRDFPPVEGGEKSK